MRHFISILFSLIQKYIFTYDCLLWLQKRKSDIRSYWLNSTFKNCHYTVRFHKVGQLCGMEFIEIGKNVVFGDYIFLTAWDKKKH